MTTTLSRRRSRTGTKARGSNVRQLRERFGCSQRVFARLMGVSERSLISFEKRDACSETVQRQVNSLSRLRQALARVIRPEAIGDWFQRPNDAFGGLKPLEVVERGEIDRIWAMIYELESGTAG